MKRNKLLLPLLLIAVLLLSACGGASSPAASAGGYAKSNTSSSAAYADSYEAGWAYDEEDYEPAAPADTPMEVQVTGTAPANVKMIFTAHIELESTEFDAASNALSALVSECGGWFESSSLNNYSRYRSASYTVRVPAANFQDFCSRAGQVATLRTVSSGAEDVSERYYDLESRLATQRTKLERLQELLSRAEEMEDIITLESAISETELAIENLTGSLRKYDSLVGYSTVYLTLNEVYKVTETETAPIGFGARLSKAFKSGTEGFVDGFQNFLIDLAEVWLGLLVFLVIVAVILFFVLRGRKKRKAARAAAMAANAARRQPAAAPQTPPQPPVNTEPQNNK